MLYSIFYKDSIANIATEPTGIEEELFVRKIIDLNPSVVGISVLSPYVIIAKRLTKLIKNNSSALVIWGGVHPTISPETCIKETDIICIGEGEGAIAELATQLRDKMEYQHIENLRINNDNKIIKNPMRPLIKNLDSILFPSYGNSSFFFINLNKITKNDPMLLDNRIEMLASRGCPFTCTFCVHSLLRPMYGKTETYIRARSVENIISEIKHQLDISGGRKSYVVFGDEIFGWRKAWIDEFASVYTKEIGLPFSIESNPLVVKPVVLSMLVSAGLHCITIGIQSGTDSIRNNLFRRPEKNSDIIKADREMRKHGIQVTYDLIADNPYETEYYLINTSAVPTFSLKTL